MSHSTLSGFRAVWLMVFFDLPTNTKKERKQYRKFRKFLLSCGFTQLQYSVYGRFCENKEKSLPFKNQLKTELPPGGEVRLLTVTDFQFGKMDVYNGKKKGEPEKKPEQMLLF